MIKKLITLGADPAQDVGIPGLTSLVVAGEREAAASLQIALSQAGRCHENCDFWKAAGLLANATMVKRAAELARGEG